jgi:2-polyprenyl-3-methyl-5-hydroxy-6-metoxy-1,4-benzoquinol methylase
MRFTPAMLSEVNPTYRAEALEEALTGKEHLLTYSRCVSCNMVYCGNVWDEDVLRSVYEQAIDHSRSKATILTTTVRAWRAQMWADILRVLRLMGREELGDLKLIDYGCGWGDFLDVVDGFGVLALGHEIDRAKIQHVRERGLPVTTDVSDLKSFGPADVLVMIAVLEHLQDPGAALSLARELLKPNGLLVVSVMDYRSKYTRRNVNRIRKGLPALTQHLNPVEHVSIFDYDSVMNLLKRHRFEFVSTAASLRITDLPNIRYRMPFVRVANRLERLSTRVVRATPLPITVYCLNTE